jgi:selenocysteine lyase/cysteine desulfurase
MLYLDQAATSWPKPDCVLEAVRRWYEELGVSAARGSSARCAEVAAAVEDTRAMLGRMLGLPGRQVAFTSGATESLNLALRAVLRHGDRVLTTAYEHSSVVRPLTALQQALSLHVDVLAPDPDLLLPTERFAARLQQRDYRLVVFTHASNVTGVALDAVGICNLARSHGAISCLDTSQTIGQLPVNCAADLFVGSAHKALQGPPGLGFLAARPELDLRPQKQGGTGSSQVLATHPTEWPAAFEAGTPNTPAILGLGAALRHTDRDRSSHQLESALTALDALSQRLQDDHAYRVWHAPRNAPRTPVLSFVRHGMDPAEIGAVLDAHDIHARTGHHCAPWIHEYLQTTANGTVRISPGADVSADDILRVWAALDD